MNKKVWMLLFFTAFLYGPERSKSCLDCLYRGYVYILTAAYHIGETPLNIPEAISRANENFSSIHWDGIVASQERPEYFRMNGINSQEEETQR